MAAPRTQVMFRTLQRTIRNHKSSPIVPARILARAASTTSSHQPAIYTRQHHERRVVPFSRSELYQVVADVDEYSEFVPWCTASAVTKRIDDHLMVADLSVGFKLLSENYTSVVTLDPLRSVKVDVPTSKLFDYLITDWAFQEGLDATSSQLTFYLEFAFRNPLYQRVTDIFFEEVVKQMVGAFEKRCHVKYRHAEHKRIMPHRW